MCDAVQSASQFLAEEANVRFAKHLEMFAFDFTDFHAPHGAACPSHLWIANAKVRLARSLKQKHRGLKTRNLEIFPGPIRVRPAVPAIPAIPGSTRYPAPNCPAHSGELLTQGKATQSSKALVVAVDGPQRANLGILQDPRIKDCKHCYLFAFRLQLENHVLCD